MFRLPTNRRARIQLSLVFAFLALSAMGAWLLADYLNETTMNAALYEAVIANDIDRVRSLLADGADPNGEVGYRFHNDDGFTFWRPLEHAIDQDNPAMMRLLVESGANLYMTVHYRDGFYTETWEKTALEWALYQCNTEAAQYLVFESGKFEIAREDLDVLMLLTAKCGDVDLIEYWIEHGGNAVTTGPNSHPFGPQFPLHHAVAGGNEQVIRLLVRHGADVNHDSATYPRGTPLYVAMGYGELSVLELLLDLGADPNQRSGGYTALHAAVDEENADAVRVLLERGADPSIPDTDGNLAVTRARELGRDDIVELIRSHEPAMPQGAAR